MLNYRYTPIKNIRSLNIAVLSSNLNGMRNCIMKSLIFQETERCPTTHYHFQQVFFHQVFVWLLYLDASLFTFEIIGIWWGWKSSSASFQVIWKVFCSLEISIVSIFSFVQNGSKTTLTNSPSKKNFVTSLCLAETFPTFRNPICLWE